MVVRNSNLRLCSHICSRVALIDHFYRPRIFTQRRFLCSISNPFEIPEISHLIIEIRWIFHYACVCPGSIFDDFAFKSQRNKKCRDFSMKTISNSFFLPRMTNIFKRSSSLNVFFVEIFWDRANKSASREILVYMRWDFSTTPVSVFINSLGRLARMGLWENTRALVLIVGKLLFVFFFSGHHHLWKFPSHALEKTLSPRLMNLCPRPIFDASMMCTRIFGALLRHPRVVSQDGFRTVALLAALHWLPSSRHAHAELRLALGPIDSNSEIACIK